MAQCRPARPTGGSPHPAEGVERRRPRVERGPDAELCTGTAAVEPGRTRGRRADRPARRSTLRCAEYRGTQQQQQQQTAAGGKHGWRRRVSVIAVAVHLGRCGLGF